MGREQPQGKGHTEKKPRVNREQIKKACLANNPRQVQQAILNWAAATWPQDSPTNLKNLAEKVGNAELTKAFAELEEDLYSPVSIENWDGNQFWQLIAKNLQKPNLKGVPGKGNKKLPPLYADT